MRAFVGCLATSLLFLSGCANTASVQSPPATPIRNNVLDQLATSLDFAVRDSGWEPEVRSTGKTGQTSLNAGESWDETATQIIFTVRRASGGNTFMTLEEATTVLRSMRSDLRKTIQSAGGEVIEAAYGEAYREKTLTMTYKLDKVAGTIKVALSPMSDRPDETLNKLQFTVREQELSQ